MPKFFISYRRDDTGYVARMLADALVDEFGDDSVFMDIDAIPLGVDFRDHIAQAVGKSDTLLALIGDLWLDVRLADQRRRLDDPLDFVRLEITSALERGIPVIPILTSRAKMPSEHELPAPMAAMAYRNAAELRSGRHLQAHLQAIVDELRERFPRLDRPSDEEIADTPSADAAPADEPDLNSPSPSRSPSSKSSDIVSTTTQDDALKAAVSPGFGPGSVAVNAPAWSHPASSSQAIDALVVDEPGVTQPFAPTSAWGVNPFRTPSVGGPTVASSASLSNANRSSAYPLDATPLEDESEEGHALDALRAFPRFALLLYWPPSNLAKLLHVGFYVAFFVSSLIGLGLFMLSSRSEFLPFLISLAICYMPAYLLFWLPATCFAWARRARRQART